MRICHRIPGSALPWACRARQHWSPPRRTVGLGRPRRLGGAGYSRRVDPGHVPSVSVFTPILPADMGRLGAAAGGCAFGYAVGSLPFGVWIGRAVRGLDVREYGSGAMGTTNVLRTVGPSAAVAVFALDVAKGVAAVTAARLLGAGRAGQVAAGIAAVAGHSWPALARFRGGKGVATGFGGLLMTSPEGALAATIGGLGALAATRRVSVGSLAAVAAATLSTGIVLVRDRDPWPLAYTLGVGGIVVLRHRDNIRRLARGEEPEVRWRATSEPPPPLAA